MDMYAKQQLSPPRCPHSGQQEATGLCIITVGNSLRGDDGIAAELCDKVPQRVLEDVCRFDLGTYTSYLTDCLQGHTAAIIIDSTCDGLPPGSVTIVDLNAMLEEPNLSIKSTHGMSVADELKLASQLGVLPSRLIFFGVEIGDVDWDENISPQLQAKLPQLVSNLSFMIARILEALKKNA